ncbi:MAG: hypothetical protein ACXACY_13010 [Candidatus Hodarchaeales archaeon]|jgi:hypothetical protein
MEKIREKLLDTVDMLMRVCDERGKSNLATCNHYNWDQDIYNYRHEIVKKLRSNGYNVGMETNWGVIDIIVTKKIVL